MKKKEASKFIIRFSDVGKFMYANDCVTSQKNIAMRFDTKLKANSAAKKTTRPCEIISVRAQIWRKQESFIRRLVNFIGLVFGLHQVTQIHLVSGKKSNAVNTKKFLQDLLQSKSVGRIAQLVEHRAFNAVVDGSNPSTFKYKRSANSFMVKYGSQFSPFNTPAVGRGIFIEWRCHIF